MRELQMEDFRRYWEATDIIHEYNGNLFTFGDMKLPYIFVARSSTRERVLVRRGYVVITKPNIVLPGQDPGFELSEGFGGELPQDVVALFRNVLIPNYNLANRASGREVLEYGGLGEVISKLKRQLVGEKDNETSLIKGLAEGQGVSLLRYVLGLSSKSGDGNIREYYDHLRRQRQGGIISSDERVTDEDLRRLFSRD
jgi:hypothetical protein